MTPFRERLDLARHADSFAAARGMPAGGLPASSAAPAQSALEAPPAVTPAPARAIPVRNVPRAAVEAVVMSGKVF